MPEIRRWLWRSTWRESKFISFFMYLFFSIISWLFFLDFKSVKKLKKNWESNGQDLVMCWLEGYGQNSEKHLKISRNCKMFWVRRVRWTFEQNDWRSFRFVGSLAAKKPASKHDRRFFTCISKCSNFDRGTSYNLRFGNLVVVLIVPAW